MYSDPMLLLFQLVWYDLALLQRNSISTYIKHFDMNGFRNNEISFLKQSFFFNLDPTKNIMIQSY